MLRRTGIGGPGGTLRIFPGAAPHHQPAQRHCRGDSYETSLSLTTAITQSDRIMVRNVSPTQRSHQHDGDGEEGGTRAMRIEMTR
jgi:hypothetical protein